MIPKYRIFIYTLILIGIFSYSTAVFYLFVHESAHANTFRSFGIGSKTTIDYRFLSAYTIAENNNCASLSECLAAQSNIDAVGYHFALIVYAIWSIFLVFIIFKIYLNPLITTQ